MTMTHSEADRVVDLVEAVAKIAAQIARTPEASPKRPELDALMATTKAALANALRVS